MSADGSDARRLTSNTSGDYQPAWSPDGSRIAFSRGNSATSQNIYFASIDGSSILPFVTDHSTASDPSWSPDGRNLAFAPVQCPEPSWYSYYDYCSYGIEIRSADGTKHLSIAGSNDSNPRYQP